MPCRDGIESDRVAPRGAGKPFQKTAETKLASKDFCRDSGRFCGGRFSTERPDLKRSVGFDTQTSVWRGRCPTSGPHAGVGPDPSASAPALRPDPFGRLGAIRRQIVDERAAIIDPPPAGPAAEGHRAGADTGDIPERSGGIRVIPRFKSPTCMISTCSGLYIDRATVQVRPILFQGPGPSSLYRNGKKA